MNVSAAPPPAPAPAADKGASGGVSASKTAPSAFDDLMAEVGASSAKDDAPTKAPPKSNDAKAADDKTADAPAKSDTVASKDDDADADKDAADKTDQSNPGDPALAAALAALMNPPAAQAAPPTTTSQAPVDPAAVAVVEPVTPVLAAGELAVDAAATSATGADAAQMAVDAAATADVAPVGKTAGETPVAKTERMARNEATPTTEGQANAAAKAVETQTADAVSALTSANTGGEAQQDTAQNAPATADTSNVTVAAPQTARAADTAAPVADAQVVRGSPDTVAKLSADILKKLDGRSTRFDVALDPLGLGHVSVKVEIASHGHMTAALQFGNAAAANELRNRAGELRSALQQAGFDVPDNGLSFDVANQDARGNGNQNAWGFQDDSQPNTSGGRAGRLFEAALSGAESLVSDIPYFRASAREGVDVRI